MKIYENLHDKWATSQWHQLWADDEKAFVFMPLHDSPKEMLVIADDGDTATATILPFSEAMDEWNSQINEHLAQKAAA